MDSMGYGKQPYIVFKHTDIEREHLHIVSVNIDEKGKPIDRSFYKNRSTNICRQIEKDFDLHVPTKQQQDNLPLKKIEYKKGNIKHQVGNIVKSLSDSYNFQSLGEYRILLNLLNVTVEEVKGEWKGKKYAGLQYSAMDNNGNKQCTPFKASLFSKDVGYTAIQKHFDKSKKKIESKKIKDHLKLIISNAFKEAKNKDHFNSLLKESNVEVVFRENEAGRIYGATFIDHSNQCVLNGSRIGKEYSANVFNEHFNILNHTKQQDLSNTENSNDYRFYDNEESILTMFGISDIQAHGDNYEDELFKRKMRRKKRRRL